VEDLIDDGILLVSSVELGLPEISSLLEIAHRLVDSCLGLSNCVVGLALGGEGS